MNNTLVKHFHSNTRRENIKIEKMSQHLKILILVLLSLAIERSESIDCSRTPKTDEARLKNELLCDYDKTIKPGGHSGNKTMVDLKLIIKHFEFNDNEQLLKVHSWLPIVSDLLYYTMIFS